MDDSECRRPRDALSRASAVWGGDDIASDDGQFEEEDSDADDDSDVMQDSSAASPRSSRG